MYGDLSNVKIVTLAPELAGAREVIKNLTKLGVTVSVGKLLVPFCSFF